MLTDKQKMAAWVEEWDPELQAVIEEGCKMLNREHLIPHITTRWSTTMATCGGRARSYQVGGRITMNTKLCFSTLKKEGPEKARVVRHNTFWHELAHILAPNDAEPHGPVWKRVMRQLGRTPDRCHRQDVTDVKRAKQRRYRWYCACGRSLVFTSSKRTRMINSISEGSRRHRCPRCCERITVEALEAAEKIRIPTPPPPQRAKKKS